MQGGLREEVVITRAGKDPVVIVALDDYQCLPNDAGLGESAWEDAFRDEVSS
ncbi:hypothetical protein [Arthrobacter tumbae]|uniref:hypothetical protein n=1 Tax=Arthrobacter tumbae TaxID=163874 RepID=UPI00195A2038|nr:hypothetical protein [Arthrobacter tumbae]MBM7782223.1 hypothetical protein [Arthrobacter tumbae]